MRNGSTRSRVARATLAGLALSIALASSTTLARAYLPEPTHDALARAAIAAYDACLTSSPDAAALRASHRAIDDDAREGIVAGDVAEDSTHLLRRAWNWHFYSADERPLWHLGMDRTLNRVFGEIAAALASPDLDDAAIDHETGRAMHFLEDVTVPAHVVPVYHGLFVSDAVDGHEAPGLTERLARHLPAKCAELAAHGAASSPREILDRTAQATLARLEERICPDATATWSAFWLKPRDGDFFGAYADTAFGVETEIAVCRVTRAHFDRFVLDGHVAAVLADVTLLFHVRANARRSPGTKP